MIIPTPFKEKKQLQSYTNLLQHDPEIINKIKGFLANGGASLQKRGKTGGTAIRFQMAGTRFTEAKEIHESLSRQGYCNPKPLQIKYPKSSFNESYVCFTTYSILSFNEFGVLFPKKEKTHIHKYKNWEELSEEVRSILIGSMLGDGFAQREYSRTGNLKNTRVCFIYTAKKPDYPFWLHKKLSSFGYCNPKPLVSKTVFDSRTQKEYTHFTFKTFNLKSLNELHSLFYKKTGESFIKTIPDNVGALLTPQALAVWFMDDGSFNCPSGYAKISTEGFLKAEVALLRDALQSNFNINVNLHKASKRLVGTFNLKVSEKDQYFLYIPKKEVEKLRSIVLPYIIPSMYYKLGLDLDRNLIPLKRKS